MNAKTLLIVTACLLAVCGQLQAAGAPTTAPATPKPAATTAPTTSPAGASAPTTVVATVGTVKITSDRIDGPLKTLPPGFPAERIPEVRAKVLDSMITAELVHTFLEAQKVAFDQKSYDEFKVKLAEVAAQRGVPVDQFMTMNGLSDQQLRDQVRLKSLTAEEMSKDKVDAFIKANPSCFDGTKVTASHILIQCTPTASTKEQKAAIDKLEKIAADVKAGTVTFEKAAKEHSACPSGKKAGGDLGEFEFSSMVPPFAMKAFAMKIGDTSDVVRTQFGFHVIHVTKRTDGTGKPGTESEEAAKNCMFSMLQNQMFDQALTTAPIVINGTK